MAVAAGVIVGWPSTAASIPSGWTRVTALDDRYLKGSAVGVDPGATGGADAHTHSEVAPHVHVIGATHSHTGVTSSTFTESATSIQSTGGSLAPTHNHTSGGATATSESTGIASVNPTAATTSDLTNTRNIWIESDGTPAGIPSTAWAFWDQTGVAIPASWTLKNIGYVRGAAGAGDGGGTGTAATHIHVGVSHTHDMAHTHPEAVGGTSGTVTAWISGASSLSGQHTHPVTWSAPSTADTGATAESNTASAAAADIEPEYVELVVMQNDTGGDSIPLGTVCGWDGLLSSIPVGWILCDGSGDTTETRGKYIKAASAVGNIGNTGGSATHVHTAGATHVHTATHTHEVTFGSQPQAGFNPVYGGGAVGIINVTHTHTGGTSGSSTDSTIASVGDVPAVANNPQHAEIAFIRWDDSITDVLVTSPTHQEVKSSPAFTATWSYTDGNTQNDYRVRIYTDATGAAEIYDSGVVASATKSHAVPVTSGLLNNTTYYLKVTATDIDVISGTSQLREFSTIWTPPTEIANLAAVAVGGDT